MTEEKCPCNLCCAFRRLEDFGVIREKLSVLLDTTFTDRDMRIFDMLSKHEPWWNSEHEIESDKLYDLRCMLMGIESKLLDIWTIANAKEDE